MEEYQLPDAPAVILDDKSGLYYETVCRIVLDERFILTTRGYMGLAPRITQEGDTCGIIFGSKMPCILRRAAQENHYKYLGATSLIGKKSSEAEGGGVAFNDILGAEESKDWVEWGVEEQDIYLC